MKKNVKITWDTIYVCDDFGCKKAWVYKKWDFITTRDPAKHTFVKLNAYGFNVDVLEWIKNDRADSKVLVKQKWTRIYLIADVKHILENWVYLVFNWEKQVFYPKDKFGVAI